MTKIPPTDKSEIEATISSFKLKVDFEGIQSSIDVSLELHVDKAEKMVTIPVPPEVIEELKFSNNAQKNVIILNMMNRNRQM